MARPEIRGSGIRLIELVDQPFQIRASQSAVELSQSCTGQQVVGGAIAIEIDPADVGVEGRSARIREVESQLETPGQVRHPGEIENVSEVRWKRTAVLKPVVEIESVAIIVSGVAGIGVRAQKLKPM